MNSARCWQSIGGEGCFQKKVSHCNTIKIKLLYYTYTTYSVEKISI